MSYCVVRLLNYILRAFFKNFLICPVPGIFFVLWYLVPRSVVGPSAVSIASICCMLYIFYIRGTFFDFPQFRNFAVVSPVFPLFIPLPRHVVVHCFFDAVFIFCYSRSRVSFFFLFRGKMIVAT